MFQHVRANPTAASSPSAITRGMRRRHAGISGMALIQMLMAMGVIVLCGASGLRALIETNRKAAAMRTFAQARAIVQRNIDSALGVPFDKVTTPAILAITGSGGAVYDDDGGGDNMVTVSVGRTATNVLVRGTLTRTVVAEPNPDNADIRRVTFRLDYTFRARPYSFSMTTLRAMD